MQKYALHYFISAEAFRYNVYHFQCMANPEELTVILVFFPVVGIKVGRGASWGNTLTQYIHQSN